MKHLVILGIIVLCIYTAINTNALETLVFFVLTGRLPIIDLSIPPLAMLLFWILLIPLSIAIYKTSNSTLWSIIETIGKIHQRHINRSQRWISNQVPNRSSMTPLIVITMVYMAKNLPAKNATLPTLYLRRRLEASQLF